MKRRLLALLLVVSAGLVAGCSALNTLVSTDRALRDAGYQSVTVSPKPSTNSLSVQVTVSAVPSSGNVSDVGRIVWSTFHESFDYVDITVHGTGPEIRQRFTFSQMVDAYGQRNPSWNSTSVKSGTARVGVIVLVGVVVVVGLVVGIVLLARRRSRRRRPPWQGPFPGGGYPGSGYPPGPYGPQPWGGPPQQPPPWGGQPQPWGGPPQQPPPWGGPPQQPPPAYPPRQPPPADPPRPASEVPPGSESPQGG